MYKLYFTKQFTNGTLKGLIYMDSLSFSTKESAAAFDRKHRTKDHKDRFGGAKWRIIDSSFQNYKR